MAGTGGGVLACFIGGGALVGVAMSVAASKELRLPALNAPEITRDPRFEPG